MIVGVGGSKKKLVSRYLGGRVLQNAGDAMQLRQGASK